MKTLINYSVMAFLLYSGNMIAFQKEKKHTEVMPQIVLKEIINKTQRNFLLTQGTQANYKEFTIHDLPKKMKIYRTKGVIRILDETDPNLNIVLTATIRENEVQAELHVYGVRNKENLQRTLIESVKPRNNIKLFNIILELKGDNLEKSTINLIPEPQSLTNISIETLVRDIKAGKIKPEEAKKNISQDLYKKLEKKLNRQ